MLLPLVAIVLRRLGRLLRPDHLRGLARGARAQPAHLGDQHPALRPVRRADGDGAGPHHVPRAGHRCAPWCCCRWCCRRSSAASRCSTPSAAAGCSARPSRCSGIQVAFSTTAVVMAQTFVALPFLVVSLEGALRTAGQRYEVVAASLGAGPTTVFRRVTLPLVLPGLVSGAVLAFARALGEFGATITFAGSLQGVTRTLPLEIYLQPRDRRRGRGRALAGAGRRRRPRDRLRPAGQEQPVTFEYDAAVPERGVEVAFEVADGRDRRAARAQRRRQVHRARRHRRAAAARPRPRRARRPAAHRPRRHGPRRARRPRTTGRSRCSPRSRCCSRT